MSLDKIVSSIGSDWPDHKKFIDKNHNALSEEVVDDIKNLAETIDKIIGQNLDDYVASYRFICKIIHEEEYYFQRNGSYRYSKISDVINEVYANSAYMQKYMRGLVSSTFKSKR